MSSVRINTNIFVVNLSVRFAPRGNPTVASDASNTSAAQSSAAPTPTDTYEPTLPVDTSHDPAGPPGTPSPYTLGVVTSNDPAGPPTPSPYPLGVVTSNDPAGPPAPPTNDNSDRTLGVVTSNDPASPPATDAGGPVTGTDTGSDPVPTGTTPTPVTPTPTDNSTPADPTTTTPPSPQTPPTQPPVTLPRNLQHGYGYGPFLRRVQDTVLSALSASKPESTADPDKVVENAIAQYLNPPATPTASTDSATPHAARHGEHHSRHSFFHALRQYGITPKDFRADFIAAVRDVRTGQAPPSSTSTDTVPGTSAGGTSTGGALDTAA